MIAPKGIPFQAGGARQGGLMKERLLEGLEHDTDQRKHPDCAEIIDAWYGGLPESERHLAAATIASLSLNQLLTGIFTGLAQRGITSLSLRDRRIDEVFVATCGELDKLVEKEGLEPPFMLRAGLWSRSHELRTAFSHAVQRGAIKFNFCDREIRLSADTLCLEALSGQTGGAEMYKRLADALLAEYGSS